MTDPAILDDYTRSYDAARRVLAGRSHVELCMTAVMSEPAETEAEFGAADAVADLVREAAIKLKTAPQNQNRTGPE